MPYVNNQATRKFVCMMQDIVDIANNDKVEAKSKASDIIRIISNIMADLYSNRLLMMQLSNDENCLMLDGFRNAWHLLTLEQNDLSVYLIVRTLIDEIDGDVVGGLHLELKSL